MVARPARDPRELPPPTHGLRVAMSYEEFIAWAPSDMFCEWANGEAIVAMPVTPRHQRVLGLLHTLLSLFVQTHALGRVWTGPMVARLWPGGPGREPDVFFVRAAHLDRLTEEAFEGGPDLVVEIVSDDSVGRDRDTKRTEYARAGVGEYWL